MIYLLEDDDNIRKLVEYALCAQNFEAKGFGTPSEFFAQCEISLPSMVILDVMLPEQSGLEILKLLKNNEKTSDIPVIMLTAKGTEFDKVIGLDSGADDYISKPFGMTELIARIKAVFRRTGKRDTQSVWHIGELTIDNERHSVMLGESEIQLSYKEYELLLAIVNANGRVLTRDALLNSVWGYGFDGETRTVDVHVRHLRAKLGDYASIIETVKGVGYKLSGKGSK